MADREQTASETAQQRRAAGLLDRDVVNTARVLDLLGIRPEDVYRLIWSRTVNLGAAGQVTLTVDVDPRHLDSTDADFLADLRHIVQQLAALHSSPHGPARTASA